MMNPNKPFKRMYLFLGSLCKTCPMIQEWYYDLDTCFQIRSLQEIFSVEEVTLT